MATSTNEMIAITEAEAAELEANGVTVTTCYAVPKKLADFFKGLASATPAEKPAEKTPKRRVVGKHLRHLMLCPSSMTRARKMRGEAGLRAIRFVQAMEANVGTTRSFTRDQAVEHLIAAEGMVYKQASTVVWHLAHRNILKAVPEQVVPKQMPWEFDD